MTKISVERAERRLAKTAPAGTWRFSNALVKVEIVGRNPSEFRIGSFHAPADCASTAPMLVLEIGMPN